MENINQMAVTPTDSSIPSSGSEVSRDNNVTGFLKARKWVSDQLYHLELQNSVDSQSDSETKTDDAETLMNSITKLKKELLMETANLTRREAVLRRIELGEIQLNSLIVGNESGCGDVNSVESLKELVMEKTKLSSEILEKLQSENLQSKIDDMRQQNRALQRENRSLMNEIKLQQESANVTNEELLHDSDIEKYKTKLDKNIAKIEILKNVLQGLIFVSGTDWAQDEFLLSLVLSLGERSDF